ncbi:MAG TPA: hypothetical protein RMG48_04590 [Myxococcales bacterium LLY-WYZ-16_1]|nr:hypothetical protein [Myxococcales bacterium LLY-WYZ-16_1]
MGAVVTRTPRGRGAEEVVMRKEKLDHEVQKLQREHQELEQRLARLDRQVFLNPHEELERKRLQKLKLFKKDRMAELGAI